METDERCPIKVRDIGYIIGGSRDKPHLRCWFHEGHEGWHRFDAGRMYWAAKRKEKS